MEATFDSLKDLLLLEQFSNGCSLELSLFLKERQPKTIGAVAALAEQDIEARGGVFGYDKPNSSFTRRVDNRVKSQQHQQPQQRQRFNTGKSTGNDRQVDISSSQFNKPNALNYPHRDPRPCYICHSTGHIARNCWNNPQQLFDYDGSFQQQTSTGIDQSYVYQQNQKPPTNNPSSPTETEKVACMYIVDKRNLDKCCSHDGMVTLQCGHNTFNGRRL